MALQNMLDILWSPFVKTDQQSDEVDFFATILTTFDNEKKMSVVLAHSVALHSESISRKDSHARKRALSEEAMCAIAIVNKKATARRPDKVETKRIGADIQATIDPWKADTNVTVPNSSYDRNDQLISAANTSTPPK
jgi:hypothetical protein